MRILLSLLLLFTTFLASAQQGTKVEEDVLYARKWWTLGPSATKKSFNEIVYVITANSTHIQVPSAKAVWDLFHPDDWGVQVAITDETLAGNGTTGSPLKIASQGASTGDVLTWNGTTWVPQAGGGGGGSIDFYDIALISPLPTQPIPEGSIAFKTYDLNGSKFMYVSDGASWVPGGAFLDTLTVNTIHLIDEAVTGDKINQMGATNNQVLTWTGSTWEPADPSGSGTGGHVIRDNGVDETTRAALNFITTPTAIFTLTDDAVNNETEIRVNVDTTLITTIYDVKQFINDSTLTPVAGTGISVNLNPQTFTITNTGDLSNTNEIQQVDVFTLTGATINLSLSSDGVPNHTINLAPAIGDSVKTVVEGYGIDVTTSTNAYTVSLDTSVLVTTSDFNFPPYEILWGDNGVDSDTSLQFIPSTKTLQQKIPPVGTSDVTARRVVSGLGGSNDYSSSVFYDKFVFHDPTNDITNDSFTIGMSTVEYAWVLRNYAPSPLVIVESIGGVRLHSSTSSSVYGRVHASPTDVKITANAALSGGTVPLRAELDIKNTKNYMHIVQPLTSGVRSTGTAEFSTTAADTTHNVNFMGISPYELGSTTENDNFGFVSGYFKGGVHSLVGRGARAGRISANVRQVLSNNAGVKRVFDWTSVDFVADDTTRNAVGFYNRRYFIPNASPSTTNGTVQTIIWTGNGSIATPSFGSVLQSVLRDSSLKGDGTAAYPLGIKGYAAASLNQVPSKTTGGITWVTPLLTEVDGVIGNEGSLDVASGTLETSIITSNTPGSPFIVLKAGSNMTLTESGDTITFASSGSLAGSGLTNRMTYWTSSGTIGYGEAFHVDTTNKRYGVNVVPSYRMHIDGVSGGSAFAVSSLPASGNAYRLVSSNITGSANMFLGSLNATTGAFFRGTNGDTSSTADMAMILAAANSGGDPYVRFSVTEVGDYHIGINGNTGMLSIGLGLRPSLGASQGAIIINNSGYVDSLNVGSDAAGDIYYRASNGTFERLPIGSTDEVLSVVAGFPEWVEIETGGGNSIYVGDGTIPGDVEASLQDSGSFEILYGDASTAILVLDDDALLPQYNLTRILGGEQADGATASLEASFSGAGLQWINDPDGEEGIVVSDLGIRVTANINVFNNHKMYYANDYSEPLKADPRNIPDVGTVLELIDSLMVGAGGEATTIGSFQSSTNADGLSLSGTDIRLHAASATTPGGVSNTTQTFSGMKTITHTSTSKPDILTLLNPDATEGGGMNINLETGGGNVKLSGITGDSSSSDFMLRMDISSLIKGDTFIYIDGDNKLLRLLPNLSGTVNVGGETGASVLDVFGQTRTKTFKMTTGATNGYILTSDASGNATWQAAPTEVDGSITNEGSLDVASGTLQTSIITSNTSGSPFIVLKAGTNMTLTESGDTITFTSGAPSEPLHQMVFGTGTGMDSDTSYQYNATTQRLTHKILVGAADKVVHRTVGFPNGASPPISTNLIYQSFSFVDNPGTYISNDSLTVGIDFGDYKWRIQNYSDYNGIDILTAASLLLESQQNSRVLVEGTWVKLQTDAFGTTGYNSETLNSYSENNMTLTPVGSTGGVSLAKMALIGSDTTHAYNYLGLSDKSSKNDYFGLVSGYFKSTTGTESGRSVKGKRYVMESRQMLGTKVFAHWSVDVRLNDTTTNSVGFYNRRYFLPNATPSVTNAVKQMMVWTGNGTVSTPAFETYAPDQTVVLNSGTGINVTGTYPTFTITNTGDLSSTNEGSLDVAAGTLQTAHITSNTSGSPFIVLKAGSNMTITESGDTITFASSGGGTVNNFNAVLTAGDSIFQGFRVGTPTVGYDGDLWDWYGSNYNTAYTSAGRAGQFRFGIAHVTGVNADGRPNVVMSLGYNTSSGGGRLLSDEAAFRFGWETHYQLGGIPSFEFHMPEVTMEDGTLFRPWSMYVRKTTGFTTIDAQSDVLNLITKAGVTWFNVGGTAGGGGTASSLELKTVGSSASSSINLTNSITGTLTLSNDGTNGYQLTGGAGSGTFLINNPVQIGTSGAIKAMTLYGDAAINGKLAVWRRTGQTGNIFELRHNSGSNTVLTVDETTTTIYNTVHVIAGTPEIKVQNNVDGANAYGALNFYNSGSTVGATVGFADASITNTPLRNHFFLGPRLATGKLIFIRGLAADISGGIDASGKMYLGGDFTPARTLHVTGEVRITDLTTDTPTRLMGADADGDVSEVSLGSNLSISGGTLTATATTTGAYIESSTLTTIDLDANVGNVKDVDGTNVAYTLPTNLEAFLVYKNGILLSRTGSSTTRDYSVNTSTNTITFTVALVATDRIILKKIQ